MKIGWNCKIWLILWKWVEIVKLGWDGGVGLGLGGTLVFAIYTIMHDERWGARLWKYSDQSVNVRGNSGFGATTRMHLSCSLVAASASSVQRVLDNLFCISGIYIHGPRCCQGLAWEWKQNLFAFWTVVWPCSTNAKRNVTAPAGACKTCFALPHELTQSPLAQAIHK